MGSCLSLVLDKRPPQQDYCRMCHLRTELEERLQDSENENKKLHYQVTKLNMMVENYGLVFSGIPTQIMPSVTEVKKRMSETTGFFRLNTW